MTVPQTPSPVAYRRSHRQAVLRDAATSLYLITYAPEDLIKVGVSKGDGLGRLGTFAELGWTPIISWQFSNRRAALAAEHRVLADWYLARFPSLASTSPVRERGHHLSSGGLTEMVIADLHDAYMVARSAVDLFMPDRRRWWRTVNCPHGLGIMYRQDELGNWRVAGWWSVDNSIPLGVSGTPPCDCAQLATQAPVNEKGTRWWFGCLYSISGSRRLENPTT